MTDTEHNNTLEPENQVPAAGSSVPLACHTEASSPQEPAVCASAPESPVPPTTCQTQAPVQPAACQTQAPVPPRAFVEEPACALSSSDPVNPTSAAAPDKAHAPAAPTCAAAGAPEPPVQPSEEHAACPNAHAPQAFSASATPANHPQCSPKPQRSRAVGSAFGAGLLGGVLACSFTLGAFGLSGMFNHPSTEGSGANMAPIEVKGESPQLAEAVAQRALPSVVAIDIYTNQAKQNPFKSLQPGHDKFEKTSLGSGVIISKDGYILTNNHVIAGADKCTVTLQSGKQYEAKLIGADPSSDLAVIKVDAQNLDAIEVGNSSHLKVGEWVMSIGSPFGLEQSVASGIVSATSRSAALKNQDGVSFYTNMIQTDAAINPGNSGGALVDDHARLIGINTMIQSETGNWSGVGFAIPVDYAMSVAHDLMEGKQPSHAQLGLTASSVTPQIAQANGLSVDSGAYVISVIDGSPAAQAGIKAGDIITSFNGREVDSVSALILNIRSQNPGDKVEIGYVRNGKEEKAQVTLGSDSGKLQTGSTQSEGFGSN